MHFILSPMRYQRIVLFIVMTALALPLMVVDEVSAKRKKQRPSPPPLKILHISTSPIPYAPGDKPLAITVDVALPNNLSDVDLLEVSSTISFPSKRSIRFLYKRLPLNEVGNSSRQSKISTMLLWDGKDQTKQFVRPGIYKYEVRAKLMTYSNGTPRTKIASLRAHGKLEVSKLQSLGYRKLNLEHAPFTSDQRLDKGTGGSHDKVDVDTEQKTESGEMVAQEGEVK